MVVRKNGDRVAVLLRYSVRVFMRDWIFLSRNLVVSMMD